MFPKALTVSLFALYLSSFAAQALPKGNQQNEENCGTVSVSTVFQTSTVTVTAGGAASTGSSSAGSGNTGSNGNTGGNGNTGSSGNNGSTGSSGSSGKGSDNASSGSSGSAGNNGGSSGNNNNGGNGGNNNGGSSNNSTAGTGSTGGAVGANDPTQTSLTLDPRVIATGFEQDGQAQQEAGQVPSLTSSNNFINFCLTVPDKPITNGQQIKTGSCNPAPMGVIAATTNMPSAKFQNPPNFGTIPANQAFTIQMEILNLETGNFVNANNNYFSAPQQVNAQGNIKGHSHVVIEKLDSLTQTTPTDPTTFAFFKGVNNAAVNNVLSVDVTAGLPAGVYRLASINSAANHQPVLVAIAQHGSLDDIIYFTVSDNATATNGTAAAGNATATAGAGAANSTAIAGAGAANATDAATGKNATGAANATDSASVSLSATGSASVSLTATGSAASSTATDAGAKGGKGKDGKDAATSAAASASASDAASSAAATATASAAADDKAAKGNNAKVAGKDGAASATDAASSAAASSSATATASASAQDAAATAGRKATRFARER